MMETVLPEFQEFLRSRSLVPEKNISFYAYRVSRFLSFSNTNQDTPLGQRIKKYIDRLRSDSNIADWRRVTIA